MGLPAFQVSFMVSLGYSAVAHVGLRRRPFFGGVITPVTQKKAIGRGYIYIYISLVSTVFFFWGGG